MLWENNNNNKTTKIIILGVKEKEEILTFGRASFNFASVVEIFVQAWGDRSFFAHAARAVPVEVVLMMPGRLVRRAPGTRPGAGRRRRALVLDQAPEVLAAQVRGRLAYLPVGRRRWRRGGQRDRRVVHRYLVAAVTRIEVTGRAARVRFLVARVRFARALVRQFRRRVVLQAARAALAAAAVHTRQRVVPGRAARRVRLLLGDRRHHGGRWRRIVVVRTAPACSDAIARRQQRRRRSGGPRLSRQRRTPRQPSALPLFRLWVVVLFLQPPKRFKFTTGIIQYIPIILCHGRVRLGHVNIFLNNPLDRLFYQW